MSYILHIDTSTDRASYLVAQDGQVMEQVVSTASRDHATTINIHIQQLLSQCGISLAHLAAVAVCGGPGSYTGLRIGLSAAKGFCFALGMPLLMQNRLNLLAVQVIDLEKPFAYYCAILPAREKEYFVSIVNRDGLIAYEPTHVTDQQLMQLLEGYTGINFVMQERFAALEKYFYEGNVTIVTSIDSSVWAHQAFQEYECKKSVNLSTAEPFYLKQVYTHN